MARPLSLVTLILTLQSLVTTPSAETQDLAAERAILMELFYATDGANWKRNNAWGSDQPICEWEGVWCGMEQNSVRELQLWDNNLLGAIPASIAQLRNLKGLNVANNLLRGELPQALLKLADDNLLDLQFGGTMISQVLTRVVLRVDSSIGACADDMRVEFLMDIDGPSNRTTYQSIRCPSAKRRTQSYLCRRAESNAAPPLDGISRALIRLRFPSAISSNSPVGLSDHAEHMIASLQWGDGRSQKLSRHAGGAPIDAWIGFELIRGLEPAGWEATAAQVPCDSLKWIAR